MQWKEMNGLLTLLDNSNKNYEILIHIILIITIIIFRHSSLSLHRAFCRFIKLTHQLMHTHTLFKILKLLQ